MDVFQIRPRGVAAPTPLPKNGPRENRVLEVGAFQVRPAEIRPVAVGVLGYMWLRC